MFKENKIPSFVSYKLLIIILSFVIGFLNPAIFSRIFNQTTFAALLLTSGLLSYLAFLDAGFGKPLYTIMREYFIKKNNKLKSSISFSIIFYILVSILTILVSSIFAFFVFNFLKPDINMYSFIFFAIGLSTNIATNNFRHIFQAIDRYVFFEKILFLKRLFNLFALSFFLLPNGIIYFSISLICLNIFLTLFFVYKLNQIFQINFSNLIDYTSHHFWFKKIQSNALFFFFITVLEVFYYNYGFIYFSSLEFSDGDIVKYSLFNKIYLSIVLFARIPADISIHLASDYFHNKNIIKFRKTVIRTLFYSIPISMLTILPFIFYDNLIFTIWVGENYFNSFLKIALIIAIFSNCFHHIAGTYLFSIGNNFKTCLKINVFSNLLILISLFYGALVSLNMEIILINISLVYLLTAFIYFLNFKRLLWN
ncbi:MAG: hypothetical protein CMF53_00075 [Legionellales bacterium]|nr:hypothetical protein [Legionellales bacterium]|tara:strand:- start:14568 stop:15839 length:1272 start_codon:yes stop_codon:yes gene_type:complete